MTDATITIPDGAWRDDGDGRLFARLWINGTGHHLEAIPVRMVTDPDAPARIIRTVQVADDPHGEMFDSLHCTFGADGPYETVEIRRKRYAVFLSPFCE